MNEDEILKKIKRAKAKIAKLRVPRLRLSKKIQKKKLEIANLQAEIDEIHRKKEEEIWRKCFPNVIPREEVQ
ncbi:MAG: hypothetical protein FIB07_17020 [Candidatus Methanoperedens sp.]|nr:hypothetical protein [Candidatus Methanoperedens sp.]